MADTVLSPNMNLPVPTVSEAPGPDWAEDVDACLAIIDQHTHAAGAGVPITPDGININSDLSFDNHNATNVKALAFQSQGSAPSGNGRLFEVGVDLYFTDGNGNVIRLTQSGSVAGSTGTITGLPSGTASASYSAGTFTFQSATNTPASISCGPVKIGEQTTSPNFITLQSPNSLAAAYSLTFPAALPAGVRYVTLDNSGNISFNTVAATGSGAPVLATSPTITTPTINSPTISTPTFSGNPAGTIVSDAYNPTITFVFASGSGTTSFVLVTKDAYYQRVGKIVTVYIQCAYTATVSGGPNSYYMTTTLPVATASLAPSGSWVDQGGLGAQVFWTTTNVLTTAVRPNGVLPCLSSGSSVFTFQFSYQIS